MPCEASSQMMAFILMRSTTLAAMINHINENVYGHILTVEDPIEFVHESKRCLIICNGMEWNGMEWNGTE